MYEPRVRDEWSVARCWWELPLLIALRNITKQQHNSTYKGRLKSPKRIRCMLPNSSTPRVPGLLVWSTHPHSWTIVDQISTSNLSAPQTSKNTEVFLGCRLWARKQNLKTCLRKAGQHRHLIQKQHLHVQQRPHFGVIGLRKIDLRFVLAVEVEEGLRPQTLFARFLILGCPKAWE